MADFLMITLAGAVVLKFVWDYVAMPITDNVLMIRDHLRKSEEPPQQETEAMGFDLSPSEEDYDDE